MALDDMWQRSERVRDSKHAWSGTHEGAWNQEVDLARAMSDYERETLHVEDDGAWGLVQG